MTENTETIEGVPEETIRLMVLFGHARKGEDGVHELTDAGNEWLGDWCEKRILELRPEWAHLTPEQRAAAWQAENQR